jgi:hypothetical protein
MDRNLKINLISSFSKMLLCLRTDMFHDLLPTAPWIRIRIRIKPMRIHNTNLHRGKWFHSLTYCKLRTSSNTMQPSTSHPYTAPTADGHTEPDTDILDYFEVLYPCYLPTEKGGWGILYDACMVTAGQL